VYALLRFLKILAVASLFAGSIGAVFARELEDRRRFAYALAGPSFGACLVLGFILSWSMSLPVVTTWVLSAIALSFFSIQVVLFSVGKEGRRNVVTALLILVPLIATVALMIWKPGS
jgi:hypothetical protein